MKTLLFLLPIYAWAIDIPTPNNPCQAGLDCSPAMLNIYKAFQSGNALPKIQDPLLASGECYHNGYGYDPMVRQWGISLIDINGNDLFTDGSFGFFFRENPYANWDLANARAQSPNLFANNHKIYLTENYGYADMNPSGSGESIVRYWYKQKDNILYLLGQWGRSHFITCKLLKHNQ